MRASGHDAPALLVLEDGRTFRGTPCGARGVAFGEAIFNTSMTGYQEILTDPSYCGQIVTFTAPELGNYGVCDEDAQAARPQLAGLVARELARAASDAAAFCNPRGLEPLEPWLARHGVVGIVEVDTRALTRHLRERGAMRAGIFSAVPAGRDVAELVAEVQAQPGLVGRDLAAGVSTAQPYALPATDGRLDAPRVAVLDCGVKRGILRQLSARGLALTVLPAATPASELVGRFAGVVLSNGPGDPEPLTATIATARELLGRLPLLGICLGHQILGLAVGGRTYKLRFGHHGGNHPVRDLRGGELWITAQNHGFAVDPASLPAQAQPTHVSLYDGTLEGFALPELRALAVQFHPEASPGPSDSAPVFDRFAALVAGERGS